MYYAIISQDIENSLPKRQLVRDKHIARLQLLQDEGKLLIAGPTPNVDTDNSNQTGFSGSLIIAEFDSLEDAKTWANADPYKTSGVYKNIVIKPFKKVFPNEQP